MRATEPERRLGVLTFEVTGTRWGLPLPTVRELVRAVTVVLLPRAPTIVEGAINVRGSVVPVLDVRSRFRLVPKPLEHTNHLVIAFAGSRLVAIRADRALDILSLDHAQVEEAKACLPGIPYVAGVAKLPDGLVLIHDLGAFLSEAEALALDEAVSTAPEGDTP